MNLSPKKKDSKMMAAILIGAAINLLFLLVLGGMTVYKFVAPKEETVFEAPPPLQALEPPQVKYNQQQVVDRQANAARPTPKPITTRSISSMATPSISIDVSDMTPTVSVANVGASLSGSGSGLGGGGLRMGVSAVDFFGIKSKGERVVIILDVARSMLEVERGDIEGFHSVKTQLKEVVNSLSPATLFNVIAYSDNSDVMSNDLVLANAENKQRAEKFIDPIGKHVAAALLRTRANLYTCVTTSRIMWGWIQSMARRAWRWL